MSRILFCNDLVLNFHLSHCRPRLIDRVTSNSGTAKNNGIFGKGRLGRSGEGIIEGVIVGGTLGEWERMEEDVVSVGGGVPWANWGEWWSSAVELYSSRRRWVKHWVHSALAVSAGRTSIGRVVLVFKAY